MPNETGIRLAVLIDADNARSSSVDRLLAEIAQYGTAHAKRAYGDWTATHLNGWKEQLNAHAIQPVQQFAYTTGRNSTDTAMVIDAMDLLYTGRYEGFCLVSSDSDFTRLAARLRESGLTVYGFGERKTPLPFVAACDKFVYTDNLGASAKDSTSDAFSSPRPSIPAPRLRQDTSLVRLLREAVESASNEDGWAHLGYVGHLISKRRPDFDSRSYGYAKLSSLITAVGLFELVRHSPGPGKPGLVYLRDKQGTDQRHGETVGRPSNSSSSE